MTDNSSCLKSQVAEVLGGGTGEFDEERLLKELPEALQLPERRVRAAIEGQAGDRKRNVLVQAVSQLRQRKLDDVVKSLNNLLACNKVSLFGIVSGNAEFSNEVTRQCHSCGNASWTTLSPCLQQGWGVPSLPDN